MKKLCFIFILFFVGCTCQKETKEEFVLVATWNRNIENDLAGYRLHYGLKSREYANEIKIAVAETSVVVKGLDSTLTYYFALTAFDTAGNESAFSKEIMWPPQSFVDIDTTFFPDSPAFNVSIGASKSNDPISGGRALAFWGNNNEQKAWVKFDTDFIGNFDFLFLARGDSALNEWPVLQIAIGDTQNIVYDIIVDSQDYQVFTKSLQLRGVSVYFLFGNDAYQKNKYDRNLFVKTVQIKNLRSTMLIF